MGVRLKVGGRVGAGLRVWSCVLACWLARQSKSLPKFYDAMLVVRFSLGLGYLPGSSIHRLGVGRPAGLGQGRHCLGQ